MPKLEGLRKRLDGTTEREQAQSNENFTNLVRGETTALERKVTTILTGLLNSGTENTSVIRGDVANVPRPILEMIAKSHDGLSKRVDGLEQTIKAGVSNSAKDVIKALSGTFDALERLESKEMPLTDLTGVQDEISLVSVGLRSGIEAIGRQIEANSLAIAELQKPREFVFDFVRDLGGDLKKVLAKEIR